MQRTFLRTALAGALAFATLGTASAAPISRGLSTSFEQCRENAQGAVEQAACLGSESQRQDLRLNQTYKQLLTRLSGSQRARLVTAQRAWLQSRTRDNEVEATLYDSSQPGNLQTGLNDLQRLSARADQLQHYLEVID